MTQTKIVLNTDTLFLIIGFFIADFRTFIPDPGLFVTKKEAEKWIERHSTLGVMYSYREVRIGSIK